jgi:hypothetical protein
MVEKKVFLRLSSHLLTSIISGLCVDVVLRHGKKRKIISQRNVVFIINAACIGIKHIFIEK